MGNGITNPPNTYGFGLDFDYSVWPTNAVITLCNVPWNNDYRDIVEFPTVSGQTLDQYIDSLETPKIQLGSMSYIKPNVPIRIGLPFNKVNMYNYVRVTNPVQPVPGNDVAKTFYYFLLNPTYIAPDNTEITIQLDVWQTYGKQVTFGNCYIDRGHIGIANENSFQNFGRDYLTVPEGLDYGGEYRIIDRQGYQIMHVPVGWQISKPNGTYDPTTDNYGQSCGVLVYSTTDLEKDGGTVASPNLVTAPGGIFEGIPSGASVYYFISVFNFLQFMAQRQTQPWVTQGIISATIIPDLRRYQPSGVFDSPALAALFEDTSAANGGQLWKIDPFTPGPIVTPLNVEWRADILEDIIPEEYLILKKFLTYPYMVIEMTTFTGKPITIKPESWADADATVVEVATFTAPNQRIVMYPRRYNANLDSEIEDFGGYRDDIPYYQLNPDTAAHMPLPASWSESGDDGGEYLDFTTTIDQFPTIALVNNGALGYLASNFASIPYQKESASWTAARTIAGAQTQFDQNQAGITASKESNVAGNAAATANTALGNQNAINNQLISGTAGVIGGLGGLISATPSAAGLVSGVQNDIVGNMTTQNNTQTSASQTANSVNASKQQNAIANRQAGLVNDTNFAYANYAAMGDYQNAIAGVNAQVQGASMIQPTTSGQQGGQTLNTVNGVVKLSLRFKFIDNSSVRTIGNMWLRYGYAVNQFAMMPDKLLCMTKFTYWKLKETYIISATVPENFKQTIRGIFEKGVTVWGDPAYIGNTALTDNAPLEGFTL